MQHTCLVYLFDALHMAIHVHTRMYMYRYAFMVAITRRIKAERESQIKQGNNDDEIPPRADAHIISVRVRIIDTCLQYLLYVMFRKSLEYFGGPALLRFTGFTFGSAQECPCHRRLPGPSFLRQRSLRDGRAEAPSSA